MKKVLLFCQEDTENERPCAWQNTASAGSVKCACLCHLAHGGGEGLGEGDDEAGDLGGLLGHHADLVPVGAAGQRLDDGPHDGLQHSLL